LQHALELSGRIQINEIGILSDLRTGHAAQRQRAVTLKRES
jgi:hypothetical protein